MNAECFGGGITKANHPERAITCVLAKQNPSRPDRSDATAMQIRSLAMGVRRSRAASGRREPMRADAASPNPKPAPTHHVARNPHWNARSVGDVRGKTMGCAMEKYSTQMC